MKCYYEELGVAREANDGEIKTAYRKLALRWHPDKNPERVDEAKEQFQLIQQAYDVLSDGHERAWYDNHREQILRGKNSEYEENCLDLFQYFTVTCFKGYADDAKGFYKVYTEVFEKIAAEDAEFMEDEEEVAEIPKFGESTSSYYDVVGPFYAYWQSYCTKKTYTWLCPYDIQEIKDRRVLREIEKELKKTVQKAKKERNEEVRNLVSFIRKRDKRVLAYKKLLEERAVLNRQKQEQNRIEQIRKRNRELEEMKKNNSNAFNDGYEDQLKLLEQQYGTENSDLESEEEKDAAAYKQLDVGVDKLNLEEDEEYMDDLYCIACNKTFKNEKAFGNHEASKKHRENVERLKLEMQEEEDIYGVEEETTENEEVISSDVEEFQDNGGISLSEVEHIELDSELNDIEDTRIEPEVKFTKKEKKSKKGNRSKVKVDVKDSDIEEELNGLSQNATTTVESDDDWGGTSKKSARKPKNKQGKTKNTERKTQVEVQQEMLAEVEPPKPVEIGAVFNESFSHVCVTCKAVFESKNKLFMHLKKTNHGVFLPKANTEPVDTGKKSKGKRK